MYATPRAYEIDATAPTPSGAVRIALDQDEDLPADDTARGRSRELPPERRDLPYGPAGGRREERDAADRHDLEHQQEQRHAVAGRDRESDPDDTAAERDDDRGERKADDRGGGPPEGRPDIALVVEQRRRAVGAETEEEPDGRKGDPRQQAGAAGRAVRGTKIATTTR